MVDFAVIFEALQQEWLNLTSETVSRQERDDLELVGRWKAAIGDLNDEVARRRADWLGGPRTLLSAMRVHNLEVP